MKLFACQSCGQILHFENVRCLGCGSHVGYLAERNQMLGLLPDGAVWREAPDDAASPPPDAEPPDADTPDAGLSTDPPQRYRFCRNWEESVCNWLIPLPIDGGSAAEFCPACAHNRIIPDLSNSEHRAQWQKIETAKRRLIYGLIRLGLPLPRPGDVHPEPLIFDFRANDPGAGERVLTGHEGGVITIALDEADDAVRETLRSRLGEAYRTLLGHFRHEIGHYYWDLLVRDGGALESFRALFGDERADYPAALRRHYEEGAPADWANGFVSAYASMHPWEDWAETWAHYLHILDTLETAAALGIQMRPAVDTEGDLTTRVDFSPYAASAEALLAAWIPLTVGLNSLNRSMGQSDLYPFTLTAPVRVKFAYVHGLVGNRRPADLKLRITDEQA